MIMTDKIIILLLSNIDSKKLRFNAVLFMRVAAALLGSLKMVELFIHVIIKRYHSSVYET